MAKKKRPSSTNSRSGGTKAPYRTLYLVKQVQYKTFLRLEAALQPLGVTTTQFRILTALARGGKRSSAELSRLFGVKPQTMIKQIVNLESNGLIERNLAQGSRRVLEVSMTEAGRGALRACDKAATAVETEIFSCFGPGELETYRALMEKVLAATHETREDGEEEE
ncbi:MAG TPA: MarR family transcriptional regulator [Steroidobacter sp.]|uniref:MarR family winged helix-turn-helix transcriptional regulator n=1 Tax=Steroidobacter sp. TaxID=1978227 RepID=UPI002EDABA94